MSLLVEHGADPLFVQRIDYTADALITERRTLATTALMAATGMGGGTAWVRPARAEPEARMLEAIKLALELGVDVNAVNTDGRTALDAAQALKYQSVVAFLIGQGAKPGTRSTGPNAPAPNR
jgi:hypothetical protein